MTSEYDYDVIVVGGGPGGASCALFLKQRGRKTLMLEKETFPRDKICGDAISGKSMGILRDLGLDEGMEQVPHAKVTGVLFSAPNGDVLKIPFPDPNKVKSGKFRRPKGFGFVSTRVNFDNYLFQKAKKVVDTIERFQVTDIIQENGYVKGVKGIHLDTKEEKEFRCRVLIGADGARSIVATKLGLNVTDPKHHIVAIRQYYKNVKGLTDEIEIHFVNGLLPGYFWIFPLEDGLANVGSGMITEKMRKQKVNLKEATLKVIQNNPLFKERFKDAELVDDFKGWTLPLGSKHRRSHGNGFVLIGDAASLIDPFSGEGIGNAMTSGKIATAVIDKALHANNYSANILAEYERNLRKELDPELKTSMYLQRIGSITPLLNLIISKAKRSKEIREMLSGMLANEEAKKQFYSPLFYLKMLFA